MSAALGWWLQPAVLPWVALVFGLCIGSFLNVVIHRLPKMMEREWRAQCAELQPTGKSGDASPASAPPADGLPQRYNLIVPRSACPRCGRQLRAIENIPLASFLALRGRCAGCSAPIGLRYPVVELAAGMLAAYAAWHFGASLAALGAMFFGWSLIALAAIDLDSQLLPDDITLLLLWAGLAINLRGTFATPANAVIGAIAGYLALWLVYWGFKLATGKEGMGYGDFKLLAAIGAWLGWAALPLVVLLSSVVGAAVGVAMIALRRQGRDKPIPFGPYLAAAGLIALFWGPLLSRRWLPIVAF